MPIVNYSLLLYNERYVLRSVLNATVYEFKKINGNGLSAAVWFYFASFVAGSNQSIV